MVDTFSYATAATLEHEPLCVLNDDRIPNDCPHPCIRAAGVLRYNRESESHRLNITTILPESLPVMEYPVKCEYCGEQARPSLDLTWLQDRETAPLFCCAQWQQLCEILVKQRCLFEGRHDLKAGTPTPLENKPASELEDLLFRDKGMEDYTKFILDLPSEFGTLPEVRVLENDYSIQLPVAETLSKVLSFRLSCAPQKGCWIADPSSTTEKCLQSEDEETQESVSFCEPITSCQFGLCHHQAGAVFLQKYYSNGMTFLTVFPDGSAQVFYPSGLLAVVVVVTEENGRVCIVYDDSDSPEQPIRAVFQSDGKSTCYHSNGNIWLSLNRSGGQCLDELGARVRRWCWSKLSLTPTPLYPVFLSLNKIVGVRVLGKEQVFVSFLAKGQQAKFSVGTCIQDEPITDEPSGTTAVLKEELLVLAARIRIHLAIQHLHQFLMTPSHHWLPKTKQARHLQVVVQRLVEVSAHMTMSDSDRAFIQKCYKDCL
ncbi:glutamate-rich protein 6 [Anabas testudineus]|uniref:FAM194 C-terminal domain-containing protein n=1 Tax=Anabas testudineus TaxID=64144 RepID=A0AAQ6ILD3_ANATE|nr:glutamate-rich protein 6 [Anabas testudineus]